MGTMMPLWALALFLTSMAAGVLQAHYVKYKDPTQPVEDRVSDLLGRMTLAEKIGQMTQLERSVVNDDVIKTLYIGSVISGPGRSPRVNATAMNWIDIVDGFQRAAMSTRLGIPIIYGIDAVHGNNNVYNATIFPHNVGLGVTRDPELLRKIGAATALEVRATGVPYAFAPSVAVCRDPRWGRCYESYSEDPRIVELMTEIIPGLQGEIPPGFPKGVPYIAGSDKVAGCAKHFVGDGGTYDGIDRGDTIIEPPNLFKIHMPGYYNSILKGITTIMISFSSVNGQKMHSNKQLITGFLKETLKFQGFVISDWQGIDKITVPAGANYTYSIEASINAGLDMIMVPLNTSAFIGNLTYLIKNNFIPMSRIDDAVTRILRAKFTLGLFERPYANKNLISKLGAQEHRDLAREAVRKSLVMLKNKDIGHPMIPLKKRAHKILVAGTHADSLGYQCGGWTISWQGQGGNNITTGTTILEGIKSAVHPTTKVVYSENPTARFARRGRFSYAIVVVGEYPYAEFYGDSQNLTLPQPSIDAIKNVCGHITCVVVLVTGRPVVIEPYLHIIDALVAAWLPGTEGQGVADVLFGDYAFTGKLAMTWFKSVDQLPMNVGDPHYDPLFPFGFGLTTEEPYRKEGGCRARTDDVLAMVKENGSVSL